MPFTRFQKLQQLGWARIASSTTAHACHVTCAPSRARSQRPALLQAAAETIGEEGCSSSPSLRRGWPARMATLWSSHHPACSIRYRSPHHMSLRRRTILCDVRLLASPFTLFAGRYLPDRQNRRSSFCSGRGENLVKIARFGKPLFADMHLL